MTAATLIRSDGDWSALGEPGSRWRHDSLSAESLLFRTGRDVWQALTVRPRAGTAVDVWRCDGFKARAVLKPEADLNGRLIESLYANATAGLSSGTVVMFAPVQSAAEMSPAERRVARLTEIQASLGLSMQALAELLQLSRPQLYKWFDASLAIRLQGESAARLNAVERLAQTWRSRTTAPLGPWVREHFENDRSLYDLLTQPDLPVADIERAFDAIIAQFERAPKSRSQRMREAGFTRRPSHRALPSDE